MGMLIEAYVISLLVSLVLMTGVFILACKINNFSIVDVAWSYMFGVLATVLFFWSPVSGIKKAMICTMVLMWSLRLGTHLFKRIKKEHPHEEGRYQELRKKWSNNLYKNFYLFFIFQAFSVAFLATPILLSLSSTKSNTITFTEILAGFIWIVAICGESLSDFQLKKFKENPQNKGKVCNLGLWNYSRHPNYFFEWLVWISFALYAWSSPWGWAGLISPVIMLYLLLKVTGIPATEAQSIRSKGKAYLDYQETTSMFVPWFKKKSL